MTFRGVLLFLVGFFSALSSAVAAPAGQVVSGSHQAAPRVTASPFGIPLPAGRNPEEWQAWRHRMQAELEARGSTRARANASGSGSSGIIETIAGAAPFQQPVNALKTGFGEIYAMAEDSAGNLYVASCDLGVVLKIDPSSSTTVYAGTPLPVGPAISAGDGGPATSARIACPAGLALDAANNLYITDAFSATVREVDAATGIIQTIAGTPGKFGHAGDGGPGTSALLDYPTGVALDGQGDLFIVDQYYLWRLNLNTGVIQTFAGSGFISNPCFPSATTTCPALQTNFYFAGPEIVVHGGYLYAAPYSIYYASDTLDSSLVSINLSSGSVQLLAGSGPGAGTPTSTYPGIGSTAYITGLAVDGAGNLFFSGQYQAWNSNLYANPNPNADGIYEVMANDNSIRGLAGTNTPSNNTNGDGGPAISAEIAFGGGVCLSSKGAVTFFDGSSNIRTFPIGGNLSTIAGDGWPNFFGDNGPAQQAGLTNPFGISTDPQGNVYVADTGNERVRKIDAATGVITTIAGGVLPPNAEAEITTSGPFAVAGDGNSHLYVRTDGAIEAVDLNTGTVSTLVPHVSPTGPFAFDGNKTLYYASALIYGNGQTQNSAVWMVDVATGATTQIAGGSNTHGPSGDGGPALQAGLYDVEGLALDGEGGLYLADSFYENIRKIDLNTGIISKIGGVNSGGSLPGYSGDGGLANAAMFNAPAGLAYDGAGHLTIADSGNHVLRQIDLATNIITTVVGNHTPGFGGDGSSPAAAMLYSPNAIAYDPAGNLLIADTKNYRVRRVVLHPTKLNATLAYGGASSGGVTFTATYSGLSFGFAPTGTVTFLNGSTSLGTGMIAAATDGSGNYVATLTATSAPANAATITAQYSGDVHYAAATTTIAFQQLTPSYTVSAKPASLTIKQGSSGSVTFTVTPQNGFNQAVTFQCDNATLPKGVTCSFSPASVTPNGTAAVTSTLTVQTTGATIVSLDRRTTDGSGWLRGGVALTLLLFGIPGARRRSWPGVLMMLIVLLVGAGMIGCGGGGSSNTGGSTQIANATPPGAYSIQVTTSVSTTTNASPVKVALTVTQ